MKKETKNKVTIGSLVFVLMLVGSMSGYSLYEALQSDEPLYMCNATEEITNCPYGTSGGEHTICYTEENQKWYDDDVKNCETGWEKIDKQKWLNELYGDKEENETTPNKTVPINKSVKGTVKCYQNKCVKIGK